MMRFSTFPCICTLMLLASIGCSSNAGTTSVPADQSASAVVAAQDQKQAQDQLPTDKPVADPKYATLTNLEMVEYCLPYPADEYKEDYDAAEEKGQHVLVSKDKKHKITFSGNFIDSEFLILYHDVQAEVQEITMGEPLHDEMRDDYFEISWLEGNNIVWMSKWHRKDAGETVTATFQYPAKDSTAMQALIDVVAKASTRCE